MVRPYQWGFRRWQWHRGNRPWHWLPRIYPGVNGCVTSLLVWGWLGLEFFPRRSAK